MMTFRALIDSLVIVNLVTLAGVIAYLRGLSQGMKKP